jgi:predicted phosphodiesterase
MPDFRRGQGRLLSNEGAVAMKLNVLSDLHLSTGGLAVPRTDADVVILAGDIARPAEAISWARGFAQPVLYVPGNHEFYGGSLSGTVRELKRLSAGTSIRVLDNDEVVIDGVRFLGTVLWTDFMLFGPGAQRAQAIDTACGFMRDFSRIRIDEEADTLFTPDASAELFARNASWIDARLNIPFPGPTVVITHHAPSTQSVHARFAGSLLTACFVSDAQRLIERRRVALWIHGHTHDSFDYVANGTRIVCNPRGYAKNGVNENLDFDPCFIVELG